MLVVQLIAVSFVGWFALVLMMLLGSALAIAMVGLGFQAWWWTMAQLAQAARWSRIACRELRKIGSGSHPFDEPELPKPAVFPFVMQGFDRDDVRSAEDKD